MTDAFDKSDPAQAAIKLGIEEGDGIPDLASTREVIRALKAVGFEVEEYADLADESPVPWYAPLDAKFTLSNFRQTKIGRWFTGKVGTLVVEINCLLCALDYVMIPVFLYLRLTAERAL